MDAKQKNAPAWISNNIQYNYLSMLELQLNHINEGGPW